MGNGKTIFGKIIVAILSVFASNWESFVAKLWKKIPEDLQDKFTIGIKVVEGIKTWLGGPFGEFLVHVIPGDVDDKVRDKLIEILNSKFIDPKNISNILNGTVSDYKLWQSIAADINKELTGISYGQSVITTEVAYQNFKKSK